MCVKQLLVESVDQSETVSLTYWTIRAEWLFPPSWTLHVVVKKAA